MSGSGEDYAMNIQGSVIEQLGLKQYDTVSAAVAELVANSWDADAEEVGIKLPLNSYLATRSGDELQDKGYEIVVSDDGHGMNPTEANDKFLNVGRKRRMEEDTDVSEEKGRKLMGRKGIGKLAPFGMCYTIEVRSAGGEETDDGYEVSHFIMKYSDIEDTPPGIPYEPDPGEDDGKFAEERGTEIILSDFDFKRVPDKDEFANMLSHRFADGLADFQIKIVDTREGGVGPFDLSETEQSLKPKTIIDVSDRPVIVNQDEQYFAEGRMGLARQSYDNEMQGVRIYVRGKLATVTRDFKISSGFHMENTIRSYLVGEIHCDFLDDSMDCIQANRQDILWDTKYGRALKMWGQNRVREVADKAREPKRQSTKDKFYERTDFEKQAEQRFDDPELVSASKKLGDELSKTLDEDELDDQDFLDQFVDLILQTAPHDMVLRTFQQIREEAKAGTLDLEELSDLIQKTSLAETHSLAQVASEKVEVIEELQSKIRGGVESEKEFQMLVERATWLINPEWQTLTKDSSIGQFREDFEEWYGNQYEEEITTSSTTADSKKPDFIMVSRDNFLVVIEIKPPGHTFRGSDLNRFTNYFRAFEEFEDQTNTVIKSRFPKGIQFVLICDDVGLEWERERTLESLLDEKGYEDQPQSWQQILEKSRSRYSDFLEAVRS